jgi:hypothetical protein
VAAVSLCRECEVVLWRGHETCPCCSARRPAVRVRVASRPSPARSVLGALCLATTAPAAVAADALLRRLVG